MVTALANGTILVANAGVSPWSDSSSRYLTAARAQMPLESARSGLSLSNAEAVSLGDDYPRAILAVDPYTGAQVPVSTGGFLRLPTYIAEDPALQDWLYVTDLAAFPSVEKDDSGNPLAMGAVIAIDANTGRQRVVAKGTVTGVDGQNHPDPNSYINGPNTLVFMNGVLYVANEGEAEGTIHNIVRVDPVTGTQKLVADGSGGGFSIPVGMVRPSLLGDYLYVADEPGNVEGTGPGTIWEVNVVTGEQTVVAQGGLLGHPTDMAFDEGSGDLVVATTGSRSDDYAGSIVRVNTQTGAQTLITSFGVDSGIDSVALGPDGTILVGAIAVGSVPGHLIAVDPATGAQSVVSWDGYLSLVEGITVFRAQVGSGFESFPANITLAGNRSSGFALGHSPEAIMEEQIQAVRPSAGRTQDRPVARNAVDSFFGDWEDAPLGSLFDASAVMPLPVRELG
jgi:hypothetical protein